MRIPPAILVLGLLVSAAGATSGGAGAHAGDPAVAARPAFHVTTNRDGLPQSTVTVLALDGDGYLWAGTQDGAAVFDGRKWSVVNMPNRTVSNFVRAIYAHPDGGLWFGTREGGAARYDRGAWETLDATSGLPSDGVRAILATRSPELGRALWFGTDAGLARLEDGRWTVYTTADGLPNDHVNCLLEVADESGAPALLVGTDRGLARFAGGRWLAGDEAAGFPAAMVRCLVEVAETGGGRTVWAGTAVGLARRVAGRWALVTKADGLPDDDVTCLRATTAADGSTTLWAGTAVGLVRISGDDVRTYDASSGLPGNFILSLLDTGSETGTTALFVGTLGGLARLEAGTWSILDSAEGLPSNLVYCLLVTDSGGAASTLWAGTDTGLGRLEDGRWTYFTTASGLPSDRILCLLESKSASGRALWVGTSRGLARFDAGRWTVYDTSSGLPDDGVRCLLETTAPDGGRTLWVGTYGGLARFENGRWTSFTSASGLAHDGVLALLETEEPGGEPVVWAGTYGGLARFDDGVWHAVGHDAGLPPGGIRSLHLSRSPSGGRTLWAGTVGGGASYLDLDDPAARWTTLDDGTNPALPNNAVYQIREDAAGRLYLMTNRGVARLARRAPTPGDPAAFTVTTFTTDDGLPNNECNAGASAVDSQGRIWVGTIAGIAVFDPTSEVPDTTTESLHIERAWLTGTGAPLPRGATLAGDENACAFEYALLDYTRGRDTLYRTQLVGLDDRPSDWSTDFKKEYTNLPPGRYVFTLWARDSGGNVAGPVDFGFSVRAVWWRTWPAYAIYALTLCLVAFTAVQVRIRALRRRNELLEAGIRTRTAEIAEKVAALEASERLALDEKQKAVEADRAKGLFLGKMSHELRTPLNAILGFVQLMERDRARSPEDRENLAVIARSGENLLALILDLLAVSKIEAGSAPLEEHAFDLHRLLRGLEEMFSVEALTRGLRFAVDPPAALPRYVWGDENKLRQVLIKVLGNAVKYTQRGGVTLGAEWRDGRLRVEVADTGPGISPEHLEAIFGAFAQGGADPPSQEGAGLGLTIARAFTRLMGGDLSLASAPGEGTRVTVDVTLPLASGAEAAGEARRVVGLEPGQPAYRVLVADERWESRTLLTRLLASAGFEVREARDGAEAVAAWASWRPHLVFVSTRLPGEESLAAAREIRRREGVGGRGSGVRVETSSLTPACKIVATTASGHDLERSAIFEAGCDDYLVKPSPASAIFAVIAEHLGVRYVYDESPLPDEPDAAETVVTRERLAGLPADVVSQLHRAVLEGDVEGAALAVDRVREGDERLAAALRGMVRGYRFDELQELLERS